MNRAPDCHVISLARQPEKYAEFLRINLPTGLDFKLFEGIDGSRLTREEAVRMGVVSAGAEDYPSGMIGCAASHRALWQLAATTQADLLIMEDDVYCRHDIASHFPALRSVSADWDVILLGYNTDDILDVQITDDCALGGCFSNPRPSHEQLGQFVQTKGSVAVLRLNNTFGLCCYLVSPRGAQKLLTIYPMDNRPLVMPFKGLLTGEDTFPCRTNDMMVNTLYRNINAYAVIPPLALPPNDPATSTTR